MFRTLPQDRQDAVIAALGNDDAFSCPLAVAYGLDAVHGQWDTQEQAAMTPYGVTHAGYAAFLAWNDDASVGQLAHCRAWLQHQQTVAAQLRQMNPAMGEANLQFWLASVLWEEMREEVPHAQS